MPNTKGAKKRLRQSVVRRSRNRAQKTEFRHAIRSFQKAVDENNMDEAQQLSRTTAKLVDKAAAKGVIHKNKAARIKSRMCHMLIKAKQVA